MSVTMHKNEHFFSFLACRSLAKMLLRLQKRMTIKVKTKKSNIAPENNTDNQHVHPLSSQNSLAMPV
jgi:hypothetical protein